ncbi:MAG TPA: Xaa-Pro peptidase family protein [Jatrophihabitans sp.]|nr:Xaa-Pro peptidase family protein [Jatrophihabitans sp.]
MAFQQRLPVEFYQRVQARVRDRLSAAGHDAGLFDHPDDVAYLTGFFHHPGERPVVVYLPADHADAVLLLPELEREHAEWQRSAAQLVSYPEFPGVRSPWRYLADEVPAPAGLGVSAGLSIGRQQQLAGLWPGSRLAVTTAVSDERLRKHPEEIALHAEAARITDRMIEAGIALIIDAARAGRDLPSEAELAGHVGSVGTSMMYAEHENVVVVGLLAGGLVYAGPNSAKPHGLPSGYRLRPGDTFMLSLGCAVGGRYVEGERTFLLGEPSSEQRRYYEVVRQAQQTGIDSIRPGITCAESNKLCLDVIRAAGLEQFLRHRQGHGIGIGMHEPPWLEDGDSTVLAENFVVSNEPGIYVPGHAGYRISDSMLVTADGAKPFTSYPKSLDDIVIDL